MIKNKKALRGSYVIPRNSAGFTRAKFKSQTHFIFASTMLVIGFLFILQGCSTKRTVYKAAKQCNVLIEAEFPYRTHREIERAFQCNKGRIFSEYSRSLKLEPELSGKIVFEFTIEPSGKVTSCQVVSSTMKNLDLEQRLIARIRAFKFGQKSASPMTVTYPIEFLPR